MTFYKYLIEPFVQYTFMQKALIGCVGLSLLGGPIGVFLILRRMTLMGEALSHGILPGIAIAHLLFGFWVPGFIIGSILFGFTLSYLSHFIKEHSTLSEDASFASLYLSALALGILILFLGKGNFNLFHLLFGNILSIQNQSLYFIGIIFIIITTFMGLSYKMIIYDCFDPTFMYVIKTTRSIYHIIFWASTVTVLVASAIIIGTLMSLGLIILPALIARLICKNIIKMIILSVICGSLASYCGLLLSYFLNLPTGPTIVSFLSLLFLLAFLHHYLVKRRFFLLSHT